MSKEFPLQQVLELACAAQRVNKEYLKEVESVFDSEGKFMFMKHPNKVLIKKALKIVTRTDSVEFAPQDIFIETEDTELANEIQKYFKRLMFAAVKGENEFQTEINTLLTLGIVPENKVGFIACLPSVYKRDRANNQIEKRARSTDREYLGEVGASIFDRDCEIVNVVRSKNFDAWNVDAIIDNKMVSWFSKVEMKSGPCVVVKGKIKDHSEHWKYKNPVTRLNYIKAVQ